MAKQLHADPNNSIAEVCKTLGVSRATLYRYLSLGETRTTSSTTTSTEGETAS